MISEQKAIQIDSSIILFEPHFEVKDRSSCLGNGLDLQMEFLNCQVHQQLTSKNTYFKAYLKIQLLSWRKTAFFIGNPLFARNDLL